jgi:23S rRNA (uracil1939-C5)-methyltransferase
MRFRYNTGVRTRNRSLRNAAVPARTGPVAIERLAGGGAGVGHLGAKVVFVPYTAPGDTVEIEVLEERRTWCRARAIRVVHGSADRIVPPCRSFGSCGGCDWQHLAYPAQLSAKRSILEDALRRIGRLDPPAVPPTLSSPRDYGYRHRARLHATLQGGIASFGFFRAGSHEVIPFTGCPVLHPSLEVAVLALGAVSRRHPAAFSRCSQARLDTGWDGSAVRLILRGARGERVGLPPAALQTLDDTVGSGVRVYPDDACPPLALGPGEQALASTGETFTQVNLQQNLALVAAALGLAAPQPGEAVLDLCCGLGNLALSATARGARVLGVDLDAEAVRQAGENALRLGLASDFLPGDAAALAGELAGAGRRFDLVLLNPPRTGARACVPAAAALRPSRIVVVSCDPATLARDAAAFATEGYRIDALVPIDLFPQTAHVETVVRLTRGA